MTSTNIDTTSDNKLESMKVYFNQRAIYENEVKNKYDFRLIFALNRFWHLRKTMKHVLLYERISKEFEIPVGVLKSGVQSRRSCLKNGIRQYKDWLTHYNNGSMNN